MIRDLLLEKCENPCLSVVKVAAELNEKFSASISREIFVSAKKRNLRLPVAKSIINKPETYWNNVLFADKSKFNIFGSDGCTIVWRRKYE